MHKTHLLHLVGLEQLRSRARDIISVGLPLCGMPYREDCKFDNGESAAHVYDNDYVAELCKTFGVPFWPPDFHRYGLRLKNLVRCIQDIDPYVINFNPCSHKYYDSRDVSENLDKDLMKIDELCHGLCLACGREGVVDFSDRCKSKVHAFPG